jgi:hypothetical protein
MSKSVEKIKRLFRLAATSAEEIPEGGKTVATPPQGATSAWAGDQDRETSTSAQAEGAADEPWGSNQ